MDLSLQDDGSLATIWQNSLLQPDCSMTQGPTVTETYVRVTLAVPVPDVAEALPKPPPSVDTLTPDDLATICPECLELAVEFLAQKAAYPVLKQDWLDLKAERAAIAATAAAGRA